MVCTQKKTRKLMSDVRNKPCMTHYPDFDHYCASKGQGCKYHGTERDPKQHFTGQTDKFEQSFKKIFINEEEE